MEQSSESPIEKYRQPAALIDVLDRVLDKGVVVAGKLTISVAEVDLLDINLNLAISSPDRRRDLPVRPRSVLNDHRE